MKKYLKITFGLILSLTFITSCKKEADTPPVKKLDSKSIATIDSLIKWQKEKGEPITFEGSDSVSVFGIVTMDESNGNIYKNIYLQDDSSAINVRFTRSTNLMQGDSVRIALKGTILSQFNGVLQLSEVNEETNAIVQSNENDITPKVVTISELKEAYAEYLADVATDEMAHYKYQSKLVKLENIQFKTSELNNTYADPINQSSKNRTFEDFTGNTLFIRTSGFADFAGDSLPKGSGSMVCIVSEYNGELQLILRSPEEAKMTNPRGPGELLTKDFDDENPTSGGWTIQSVIGTDTWETGTAGGAPNPYAVISNYNDGSNSPCENWLITPALDLSGSASATLAFDNAYNYGGPALELLISTDYPGTGNPNGSTWATLPATWSTGGFTWVNSGAVDLSAYLTSNVYIAFKYTGGDDNGSTWELDNITING